MSLDPNLSRWIYASANKYITDRAPSIVFTEGEDHPTPTEGAEFRMDGPRYTERSKGYWEIWIAINVLVTTAMNKGSFHDKHRIIGEIVTALDTHIPVFKFGNGVDDDREEQIGCFQLIMDNFNRIQVNHFGQIDTNIRLEQATVEAHYLMTFKE